MRKWNPYWLCTETDICEVNEVWSYQTQRLLQFITFDDLDWKSIAIADHPNMVLLE